MGMVRRLNTLALISWLVCAGGCSKSVPPEAAPAAPPQVVESAPKTETPKEEESAVSIPHIRQLDGLTAVEIVRKLAPSIVRVESEPAHGRSTRLPDLEAAVGTGVIITADGHIVTNDHVIALGAGASDRISVVLSDQRTFYAQIIGRDRPTDLAVLKIEASDLIPAVFAKPRALQVGQDVVAIGFAFDMRGAPTVTRGVISALRRAIHAGQFTIPDAIQTDAGINLGNSGGPLVNAFGEVIGINNAIVRDAQHVGFAISVAIVRPVVEALIRDGEVKRAYLGVSTREVELTLARQFKLPVARGVVVTLVAAESPAEKAGLQTDDVILKIADERISNHGELLALLANHKPGEKVRIDLYRDARLNSIEVELAKPPGAQN
jgi:S1-C subfamily serine protease